MILSCTFEEAMAHEKRDHEAELAKKDAEIAKQAEEIERLKAALAAKEQKG